MKWTEEAKGVVASLLREGLPASQIGERLGVTRNAVIGVVGRDARLKAIGFNRSPAQIGTSATVISIVAQRKRSVRGGSIAENRIRPVKHSRPVQFCVEGGPHVAGITLMMLDRHHCRWPVNEPEKGGEHLFCGMRKVSGSSYCEHHKQASIGDGTPSERRAVRDAEKMAA